MFVELGAIGTIAYGYRRWNSRDVYYMKKEIKKILIQNKLDHYTIIDVKRYLAWGYSIVINLNGKGFEKLKEIKDNIETKLGYEVFIEQNKNLKTATIKVVVFPVNENTKFKPYKTKPFEIYTGISYTMQELIVNMRKFPNVLVSGQVGAGKTEIIRVLLCNLISNFTERDVNVYFADLADVADYDVFQKCRQVKGYAKTLEETEKLFNYLIHVYTKRLEIFGGNSCKNIQEYNEKFYSKRMAYTFLVLDEFGDYFPVNKLEDSYQIKVRCYNLIKHMTRKFRKVGIYLIVGIQRPDTSILDPNLKANLCTKIGFSQNNDASSLVICDTTELANIENRKALLMYGNKRVWFKSLYIDDDLITSYIKSSLVNGSREKLDDYNKFLPKKDGKVAKENQNLPYATITKKEKKSPKLHTKTKVKVKTK